MDIQTPVETGPLLDLLSDWIDLMHGGEYPSAWCKGMDAAAVALSLTDAIKRHHRGVENSEADDAARAAEGLGRFLCMLCTACERAEADG